MMSLSVYARLYFLKMARTPLLQPQDGFKYAMISMPLIISFFGKKSSKILYRSFVIRENCKE